MFVPMLLQIRAQCMALVDVHHLSSCDRLLAAGDCNLNGLLVRRSAGRHGADAVVRSQLQQVSRA